MKTILDQDGYKIVEITDFDDYRSIRRHGSWWGFYMDHFEYMVARSPLYFFQCEDPRECYLYHLEEQYFRDHWDRKINISDFNQRHPIFFKTLYSTDEARLRAVSRCAKNEAFDLAAAFAPITDRALAEATCRKFDRALLYIHEPDEELRLISVDATYGRALRYIDSPSEAVQIAAVSHGAWNLRLIADPYPAAQVVAVQKDPREIMNIDYPCAMAQIEAVTRSPYIIAYIGDPCNEALEAAIIADPNQIENIIDPSEQLRILARLNGAQKKNV